MVLIGPPPLKTGSKPGDDEKIIEIVEKYLESNPELSNNEGIQNRWRSLASSISAKLDLP
jgi:hypothetical protein